MGDLLIQTTNKTMTYFLEDTQKKEPSASEESPFILDYALLRNTKVVR